MVRRRASTIGKVLGWRIGVTLLAVCWASWAWGAEIRRSSAPVEGEYIVVLREGMIREGGEGPAHGLSVAEMAADMALIHGGRVGFTYEHALRGFSIAMSSAQAVKLAQDWRIAYVEENGRVWPTAIQSNAPWGLARIDQREIDLDSTYQYNTTASNVHVYVLDSGIRSSHVDFGGRVLNGFTAILDGQGTHDCNSHGTHVAGILGGATFGVAKAVRLHPVRVLPCSGPGDWAAVISGIDWVTANHVKPAVANMSLGGGTNSAVDQAVTNSIHAGVTYVVAAGNEFQDACFRSPARVPPAITVASMMTSCGLTSCNDSRSVHSNWASNTGPCVDVFAPGSFITSASNSSNTATEVKSGTSMASPHVAGAAALYLSVNPSASPSAVATSILNTATTGTIINPGAGSPNRLVYSLLQGGGGGGGGGSGGGGGGGGPCGGDPCPAGGDGGR